MDFKTLVRSDVHAPLGKVTSVSVKFLKSYELLSGCGAIYPAHAIILAVKLYMSMAGNKYFFMKSSASSLPISAANAFNVLTFFCCPLQ